MPLSNGHNKATLRRRTLSVLTCLARLMQSCLSLSSHIVTRCATLRYDSLHSESDHRHRPHMRSSKGCERSIFGHAWEATARRAAAAHHMHQSFLSRAVSCATKLKHVMPLQCVACAYCSSIATTWSLAALLATGPSSRLSWSHASSASAIDEGGR
jgi:hypothetical protein